jgi:hypothetical protein
VSKLQIAEEFPSLDNVSVDSRILGLQPGLYPHLKNSSGQRTDMHGSHVNQTILVDGSQFAFQFTGKEYDFGQFDINDTHREQDMIILAVVQKYPNINYIQQAHTVICKGLDDCKIHHFIVSPYTKVADGFGYENVLSNRHSLRAGEVLLKETVLSRSPINKDGAYCMGRNVNVAYMTSPHIIEDSMWISDELADNLSSSAIYKQIFVIGSNNIPINLYGDDVNYKFLPDLGETISDYGIISAFRKTTPETFIADTMPNELTKPQAMHDMCYVAHKGAKVIDIDVQISRGAKISGKWYDQAKKYSDSHIKYCEEIVKVYETNRNLECSSAFNRLVSDCMKRLIAEGRRVKNIYTKCKLGIIGRNNRPIEFMRIVVTYIEKRHMSFGYKTTGREGAKGVIGHIVPKSCMPVDEDGFVADLVLDPASCIARMNTGQWIEQGINRISEFVRRRAVELYKTDKQSAIDMLFEYYNDLNPNYLKQVIATNPDFKSQCVHFGRSTSDEGGIYIWLPPFLKHITMKHFDFLRKKYKVGISKASYKRVDSDGNIIAEFVSDKPVCIGSKYVIALCKVPYQTAPGVGHVNQFGVPMKSSNPNIKNQYTVRISALKYGEDEWRTVGMDMGEDANEMIRYTSLHANSPTGVNVLVTDILKNKNPTNIERINITNEELVKKNSVLNLFSHMITTLGIKIESELKEVISP